MLKVTKKQRLNVYAMVFALLAVFTVVFLFSGVNEVFAQSAPDYGLDYAGEVGLSTTDIRISVIKVIRAIIGVLGIIALILILYAGFLWMTSAGEAQRIETAKKIMLNAVIGFVIIAMAFAIVQYIFTTLSGGSGSTITESCTVGECSGCLRCLDGSNYSFDENCSSTCELPTITSSQFRINEVNTANSGTNPKQDVYWCSKVQTIFNKTIDSTSVSTSEGSGDLRISQSDTAVAGSWTVNGSILSYSPADNEFPVRSADYRLHLPTSLESNDNRFLSECSLTASCEVSPPPDFQWFFHVGEDGDEVNPTVRSTYPRSDDPDDIDKNVNLSPIIQVRFSESIDLTTVIDADGESPYPGNIYLHEVSYDSGGNLVTETQISSASLIIDPKEDGFNMRLRAPNTLKPFTYYQVTLQNITDLCGNEINPSPYKWVFFTNDTAPGISSIYPLGDNVCPDSNISATFNTSMYYNRVELTVNGNWNYVLMPGETEISDANGTFRVIDVGNPLAEDYASSEHYRVYEFNPTGSLAENSTYQISLVTDLVINAEGDNLMQAWEFNITDLANCVCSPYISHLSKEQGPVGECLTISGQCFRGTSAKPAVISDINVDNANAVIGSGYTDNYVSTSIPDGFSPDDTPDIDLAITYNEGGDVPRSNSKSFYINPGKAEGPCLWSISPSSGRRGDAVELKGIRFGSSSTIRESIFYPNAIATIAEDDWSDQTLKNVIVPSTAQSGEVFVRNDLGVSNGIYFSVGYCGNGVIDSGEDCDGVNLDGKTCSSVGFVGGALSCSSACKFDTSSCSNAPKVIESSQCSLVCDNNSSISCFNDSDCGSGSCIIADSGLPSPNPYKREQDVCLNAAIYAEFNTNLDPSTINSNNIYLQKCTDSKCETIEESKIASTVSIFGQNAIRLVPSSNLEKNTTYHGSLLQGIESAAGVAMEDDYGWYFTTADSDTLCPIDKIYVSPRSAEIGQNDFMTFNASAIAPYLSSNCTVINGNSYSWQWRVIDNNDPNIGVSLTGSGDSRIASSVNTKGVVDIEAETEGKKDSGELKVAFDTCNNDAECAATCSGSTCDPATSRCTPVINNLTPDSGPTGRWTTIEGCYFKSKDANSQVTFGSVPVSSYPCSEVWTDTAIVVEVPNSLSLNQSYNVTVTDRYNLTSNSDNEFNVVSDCTITSSTPSSGIPGICSINPSHASVSDNVTVYGNNLSIGGDDALDYTSVWFNNIESNRTSNLTDTSVVAEIPTSAQTGYVNLAVESCPSNSLPFIVNYPEGVGEPCDGNTNTLTCDANNDICTDYSPSLYCDANSSCTCQPSSINILNKEPEGSNICRNALISAEFDQLVDKNSILNNFRVVRVQSSTCGATIDSNKNIWQKLLAFLSNIFKPHTTYAESDIEGGIIVRYSDDSTTIVNFTPYKILDSCYQYEVIVNGGEDGITTAVGGHSSSDISWEFITGQEVCEIHHIDIDSRINSSLGEVLSTDITNDYFFCAGRNNCSDDIDPSITGNQHEYIAQAKDKNGVSLMADYFWKENEPTGKDLIDLSEPVDQTNVFVTPNIISGDTTVLVSAESSTGVDYGSATASVDISNFICLNPWPSLSNFPFTDSSNNCTVGGTCYDMTFSTYYCRDAGYDYNYCEGGSRDGLESCPSGETGEGQCLPSVDGGANTCAGGSRDGEVCCPDNGIDKDYDDDDLPSFSSPVVKGQVSDVLKEFSFRLSGTDSLIGIRFYNNSEHLSPQSWYEKYANDPTGSITTTQADGYEAISSGRTTYVNAATDTSPNGSHNIFTNMFLLSHSDLNADTLNIYNQVLNNLKFNVNGITNNKICLNSGDYCTADSDCGEGDICDAQKIKLARDTIRMGHLNEMIYHLDYYRGYCSADSTVSCLTDSECVASDEDYCIVMNTTYPTLPAGTYTQGQSVSVWDSWNNTFASVLGETPLLDPLNEVLYCPDGYNDECWDQTNRFFYCTPESHMYHYQVTSDGSGYNLFMNMEYSTTGWNPSVSSVSGGTISTDGSVVPPCSPGSYNLKYSR